MPALQQGDRHEGSLIDYESRKIKRTVLSTTVAEPDAFMKCYGSGLKILVAKGIEISAREVHLEVNAEKKQVGEVGVA